MKLNLHDGLTLQITATPARHGPIGFETKSGEVTGFVRSIGDEPGIYVSGDTVWYSETAEVAQRFRVGLAVLFAGSTQPRGPFNVTMNTNDALEAAAAFCDAKVVSVHNLGWSHYTQSQQDLAKAFDALERQSQLIMLEPGIAVGVSL